MNVTEKFALATWRRRSRCRRRARTAPGRAGPRATRAPAGRAARRLARRLLQLRRAPQRRERDERDDQHDRGRPAEQPHRDRQVGLADDPVRVGARRERQRREGRPPEQRGQHAAARGSHARVSLCNAEPPPAGRSASFAERACVPCNWMRSLPLAVSDRLEAALQLGPLALVGLLYARRVRTLADQRPPRPRLAPGAASTRASS